MNTREFNITLTDQDAERITLALNMLRDGKLATDQNIAAERIRQLSLKIIDTYLESVKA